MKILCIFQTENHREKVVLEKNVFGEMFLTFNFTRKYTWSEILKTVKEFILRLNGYQKQESLENWTLSLVFNIVCNKFNYITYLILNKSLLPMFPFGYKTLSENSMN